MTAQFDVQWTSRGGKSKNPPNPAFPLGMDIMVMRGPDGKPTRPICKATVPYPAPEGLGFWTIACQDCGVVAAATTAGRADDPRSVEIFCATQPAGVTVQASDDDCEACQ